MGKRFLAMMFAVVFFMCLSFAAYAQDDDADGIQDEVCTCVAIDNCPGIKDLGCFPELVTSLDYFLGGTQFNVDSVAQAGGQTAEWVLSGNPSPLQQEIDAINPQIATVLFGSNGIYGIDLETEEDLIHDLADEIMGVALELRWVNSAKMAKDVTIGNAGGHRLKKIKGVELSHEELTHKVTPGKAFWIFGVDEPTKFANLAQARLCGCYYDRLISSK